MTKFPLKLSSTVSNSIQIQHPCKSWLISRDLCRCVRGYSMPVVTRALACLSSSSPFQQRPTKQALINLTNTSPSQNYTRNHIPRQIGRTDAKMDSLVARYSRPMFENEGYAKEQQEEMELVQEVPALSLKFAMPPVAQVSSPLYTTLHHIA